MFFKAETGEESSTASFAARTIKKIGSKFVQMIHVKCQFISNFEKIGVTFLQDSPAIETATCFFGFLHITFSEVYNTRQARKSKQNPLMEQVLLKRGT